MKTSFYYRPSGTLDIEERLEDAALYNAMKHAFGDGIGMMEPIAKPDSGMLMFGRPRHFEGNFGPKVRVDYWNDPGFRSMITREFHVTDYEGAEKLAAEIHAEGKDVFLKGSEIKLFTGIHPVGKTLHETLGEMVWSFLDKPHSLMVQEFLPMREERRYAIIDRQIVTCSPVANHLTPMDRGRYLEVGRRVEDMHFESPKDKVGRHDPDQAAQMDAFVRSVIDLSEFDHMILDLSVTDQGYEIIEYNPMMPGRFGLFAMNVDAIAQISISLVPPQLAQEVIRRRDENDPWPDVMAGGPEMEFPEEILTGSFEWSDLDPETHVEDGP